MTIYRITSPEASSTTQMVRNRKIEAQLAFAERRRLEFHEGPKICQHILLSGRNSDTPCGKPALRRRSGGVLCSLHYKRILEELKREIEDIDEMKKE